jgi:hypothetical protein
VNENEKARYAREYSRSYYERFPDRVKERAARNVKRYIERNREYVLAHLLTHPCIDCGECNPVVLDFDHVGNDKADNIARMVVRGLAWSTIQKEIEKCEVVCANCHRIRTARRAGDWYKAQPYSLVIGFTDGSWKVLRDLSLTEEYFSDEYEREA